MTYRSRSARSRALVRWGTAAGALALAAVLVAVIGVAQWSLRTEAAALALALAAYGCAMVAERIEHAPVRRRGGAR